MKSLEVRAAVRKLLAQKGLNLAAILTIAVGIGATATMFTFTYATVIRGLPVPEPDRVVGISRVVSPGNPDETVSVLDLEEWRERTSSFVALGGFRVRTISLAELEGEPDRVSGAEFTPDVWEVLEVEPLMGRLFGGADFQEGASLSVVIGESLWETRFDREPTALGAMVRVDGRPGTVVGVMPDGFGFPFAEVMWIPLQHDLRLSTRGGEPEVTVLARLRPGITIGQSARDLNAADAYLANVYPESNRDLTSRIEGFTQAQVGSDIVIFMKTMFFAVFLVLVVACINVANLLLAKTLSRAKEISVRRALGGPRVVLVAQLLVETLIVAVVGGAIGLALAWAGISFMNSAIVTALGGNPFYWIRLEPDAVTVGVTAVLVVVATLISGLAPALRATALDVAATLRDEGRGGGSRRLAVLTRWLVGGQTVLSVGLLAVTGVMLASVGAVRNRDYGMPLKDFVYVAMAIDSAFYPTEAEVSRFWDETLERAGRVSGVRAAALLTRPPVAVAPGVEVEVRGRGDPDRLPTAKWAAVSPGFASALGVGVADGRDFENGDGRDSDGVALVTVSFVQRYLQEREVLGLEIRVVGEPDGYGWRRIVGVVPDLWMDGARNLAPAAVLVPTTQVTRRQLTVVVRSDGAAGTRVAADVRGALEAGRTGRPVVSVRSGPQDLASRTFFYSFLPSLFGVFGLLAFGLAVVGVYGVTSYSVATRRAEIGIRMALGADRRRVIGWVLARGVGVLVWGALGGLVAAAVLVQGLQRFLVGVDPRDPVIFGSAALVMVAAGVLASVQPALRASGTRPVEALKGLES